MAALEIPALVGFRSRKFDIRHAQQVTHPGNSGFIQTINRSAPFWTAEYETPPLSADKENEARVFIDALEGSMNTFLAYDPKRVMPQAYKNQGLASNPWGTPFLLNGNYAASTIGLTGMVVGAVITKGDYISVRMHGVWYLFRAMQTVVASGATIASLLVKPRPNWVSFETVNIRYKKACCEMKLVGDVDWSDEVDTMPTLRFTAGQFINRATA